MNDRFESLRQQAYELNPRAPWNQGEQPPICEQCGHDFDEHAWGDQVGDGQLMGACDSCDCDGYNDGHEDEPPERDYYEGRY